MNRYIDPCDDCQTCHGCGRDWCARETVSPGEPDLCLECWMTEDPEAAA